MGSPQSHMSESFWTGDVPKTCQLCNTPIVGVMFDARLPAHYGSWACICVQCFVAEGCSVGIGYGQMYERNQNNRFVCTAGGSMHAKTKTRGTGPV
jgi:hypothetical protein